MPPSPRSSSPLRFLQFHSRHILFPSPQVVPLNQFLFCHSCSPDFAIFFPSSQAVAAADFIVVGEPLSQSPAPVPPPQPLFLFAAPFLPLRHSEAPPPFSPSLATIAPTALDHLRPSCMNVWSSPHRHHARTCVITRRASPEHRCHRPSVPQPPPNSSPAPPLCSFACDTAS